MNTEATWKPVVGYEGMYEVSDCGRVRSVTRKVPRAGKTFLVTLRGRELAGFTSPSGYRVVTLSACGRGMKPTTCYIHRLVAEAFLPRQLGSNVVNHLDLNKANNRVENLEWTTHSGNFAHAKEAGATHMSAFTNPNLRNRLTPEKVMEVRRRVASGQSMRSVAADYGVSGSTVAGIVRGEIWRVPVGHHVQG